MTTSAGEARAKLSRLGLTPALASQTLGNFGRDVLASYARADWVRPLLPLLTPSELFAGREYDRTTGAYDGTWLDLRRLAADVGGGTAPLVLQGLYLAASLDETSPDTLLQLEYGGTGNAAHVAFLKPHSLLGALGKLRPQEKRGTGEPPPHYRDDLARMLRDKSTVAKPSARQRLLSLEQALSALDMPESGPLADAELWTIERQLAANDGRGALDRIHAYVRSHGGESVATRYLRAHLALLDGSEAPRRIAETLAEDAARGGPLFHELELLRARAWMAAGVRVSARRFAAALVTNPDVPDAVVRRAREVVDAADAPELVTEGPDSAPVPWNEPAPATKRVFSQASAAPRVGSSPPVRERTAERVVPTQIKSVSSDEVAHRPRLPSRPPVIDSVATVSASTQEGPPRPRLPSRPPPVIDSVATVIEPVPERYRPASSPPRPSNPFGGGGFSMRTAAADDTETTDETVQAFVMPPPRESPMADDRGHMTDRPPPLESRALAVAPGPRVRRVREDVESLSMPPGLNEVRVVSTRFARVLGREYREQYGVTLRTDVQAVEWMQKHLIKRWGDSGLIGPEAALDVRRHGALLSEILARTLGAEWVDVTPTEVGYWAMFVPPRTRTWPFGRVHRFITLGHRDKDLVSYYLGLASRAREPNQ